MFGSLPIMSYAQIFYKHYVPKTGMNPTKLEIESIDLTGDYTKIYFSYPDTLTCCISNDTYIWDYKNSIRYKMIKAEGINICTGSNFKQSPQFYLYFEKLNTITKSFEFVEKGECKNCWNIFNVQLNTFTYFDIKKYIKYFVEENINNWQQKGEFEKTEHYKTRVSESEIQNKIKEFENIAILNLKNEYIKTINLRNTVIGSYDADNETFLIKLWNNDTIILDVDIATAPKFKENWNKVKIMNPKVNLTISGYQITHLKFIEPHYNKEYDYNINETHFYSQVKINYAFKDYTFNPNTKKSSSSNIIKVSQIDMGPPDTDLNIPELSQKNYHAYALIIGNEDYKSKQIGLSIEQNADYAINDAAIFSLYCKKTLGIPKKQIKLLKNATAAEIGRGLSWINNLSKIEKGNAELIFYYSGHGLPHATTKVAYIIPVDVSGTSLDYAVKLSDIYKKLTEHPAKQITVFIDACFSGGARNQGLIAMKGVKIKPKENLITNNLVIFTSSTGTENSNVYREKQHGYFTYFLLKKLKNTKGDVNYEQLSKYIIQNVSKETGLIGRIQTPQLDISPQVENEWKYWKLK